jgi:hypothetical protein
MPRLAGFALAAVVAFQITSSSRAAVLIFEQGPDRTGLDPALCPAPCFEINMWLGTSGAEAFLVIQAIQMDIAIADGGTVAALWTPFAENNGTTDDANVGVRLRSPIGTRVLELPWTLSSTVAKSPVPEFDVRLVHAADNPFTARSLDAEINAPLGPGPLPTPACVDSDPDLCELVRTRIGQGQIFLGRFNATMTGASIEVDNLAGTGALIGLLPVAGSSCDFIEGRCTIPESPSVILLGAALAGLGFLRRAQLVTRDGPCRRAGSRARAGRRCA